MSNIFKIKTKKKLGLIPRTNTELYLTHQCRRVHQVLQASLSPYCYRVWLAYPAPYPKLFQLRGWAALPYMFQSFWLPGLFIHSLPSWPFGLTPRCPLPFCSHGLVHCSLVEFALDPPRCLLLWLCSPSLLSPVNFLLHHPQQQSCPCLFISYFHSSGGRTTEWHEWVPSQAPNQAANLNLQKYVQIVSAGFCLPQDVIPKSRVQFFSCCVPLPALTIRLHFRCLSGLCPALSSPGHCHTLDMLFWLPQSATSTQTPPLSPVSSTGSASCLLGLLLLQSHSSKLLSRGGTPILWLRTCFPSHLGIPCWNSCHKDTILPVAT